MNLARGWNPDLEESYLLEYSEPEVEIFTHGTFGSYLWHIKISAPGPSSISQYSKCTKTTSFSILGFFRPRVKLGFDFPIVLPNQKILILVSKFQFLGGEKSYAGLTQKFLFCEKP